jgi:hypothetical protein
VGLCNVIPAAGGTAWFKPAASVGTNFVVHACASPGILTSLLYMCFAKQRERSLCLVVCRKPGSFCGLQLLSGDQLEQSACDIQALLAGSLVEDAPLQDELGWLNNLPDKVRVKWAVHHVALFVIVQLGWPHLLGMCWRAVWPRLRLIAQLCMPAKPGSMARSSQSVAPPVELLGHAASSAYVCHTL